MPTHVNQFTAAGRFPNGASSAAYDCTVACGVMALQDYNGRVLSTTELRGLQGDQDKNGIGLDDLERAFGKLGISKAWIHGRLSWGAIKAHLTDGDGNGVIIQGWSGALGSYDVGRAVPHALYATGISGSTMRIHDPRRSGPISIPVGVVQRFWISGLGLAGWFVGHGAGAGAGVVAGATVGAGAAAGAVTKIADASNAAAPGCTSVTILSPGPLGAAQRIIPIPRDSLADPCTVCPSGWSKAWYAPSPVETVVGGWIPLDQTGGRPNACVAPGVKVGDSGPASNLGGLADPVGQAIASAAGTLIAGLGEIGRNLFLLGAALVLILLGAYLVATAGDRRPPGG